MLSNLVLLGGNILTMNPSSPYAEAVAIRKDRVVKVGTDQEIRRWISEDTTIIYLEGKTVVPGFIDSHVHVGDFGRSLSWLDLTQISSVNELQKKIQKHAQKTSSQWILGRGWAENRFNEKRPPTVKDLDEALPDKPLILYHQSKRLCIVNSKALELAGITNETMSPPDGVIQRDQETGEPNGILQGQATDLVWKIIPEPGEDEVMDSTKLACEKILQVGVTSVHWIISSPTELRVLQRLRAQNDLSLRVYPIISEKIFNKIGDLNLQLDHNGASSEFDAVKFFVDGSLAQRTAALHQPYDDERKNKGELLYNPEELNSLILEKHKAGLHLVVHAMGDRAVDMVLTAFEKALNELPLEDHRYRVEHASVLTPELIERIKNLDITISVQPPAVSSEFSVWSAVDHLGQTRARWIYPLKTLIESGIRVIGGSDCPMEPINPLLGIQIAVARKTFPEERVDVEDALLMYTLNAAYASFEEELKGSIEEDKLADLAILSRDPRKVPRDEIRNIAVEMTILGGKIVYSKIS